jgi:hypothetical protein
MNVSTRLLPCPPAKALLRAMLLLVATLLSCGFALPETAEQRKAREKEERAWAQAVAKRYDSQALFAFLKQTINEVKAWHDVSLTAPRIGSEWKSGGRCLISGDWVFSTADPSKDDFRIDFIYHAGTSDRWLILRCVRDGSKKFHVVEITTDEVIVLLL